MGVTVGSVAVTVMGAAVVHRVVTPALRRLSRLELVVEAMEMVETVLLRDVGQRHRLHAERADPREGGGRRARQAPIGEAPWVGEPFAAGAVVRHDLDDGPLQADDVVPCSHSEMPPNALSAIGGQAHGPAMAEPRPANLIDM